MPDSTAPSPLPDLTGLCCPLDGGALHPAAEGAACQSCGQRFPLVELPGDHRRLDLRALDAPRTVLLAVSLPGKLLSEADTTRYFYASRQQFDYIPRDETFRRFKTRLNREVQYYAQAARREFGPQCRVLDLGCGNGGNRRYLESLGFECITSVDYISPGAAFLVDAHRLPFPPGGFNFVLATAVLEHFYQPFAAMSEIARVLRPGGMYVGTSSFWERWHGSYFHASPDGLNTLCESAGLALADLWAGWGMVPAFFLHGLFPRRKRWKMTGIRLAYALGGLHDALLRLRGGMEAVYASRLHTAGSYGLMARKPADTAPTAPAP